MQKQLLNKGRFILDIDTINPKFGLYNVCGKRCIFLGIIQIYYFGRQ